MSKIKTCLIFLFMMFGSRAVSFEQDSLSRFTIGTYFSPAFSSRILTVDPSNEPLIEIYNQARSREIGKMGYAFGLTSGIKLTSKWSVVTGVDFYERGYKLINQIWMDENGIYELGTTNVNFHISYLAIPLRIQFEKQMGKVCFFAKAGVSFEYRIRSSFDAKITYLEGLGLQNTELTFQRGDEPIYWFQASIVKQSSKLAFSGLLDVGLAYQLTPQIALQFATTFVYSFSSIFLEPIRENGYSLGLKFGVNYRF